MTIREQLIAHEGLRLKPYRCTAGKLTIGVGRNLEDRGLRLDEALYLLDNDIEDVTTELEMKLPWMLQLDDVRQRVLIDMAFNIGVAGLLKFKLTLTSVRQGNYVLAAKQMLQSKWADQVGRRAIGLAKMMETGKDPR
jgi:lysozyme